MALSAYRKEAVKLIERVTGAKKHLPHLSELAEHFIEECGGTKALAKMLHVEWVGAAEGSLTRVRIMDLLTRVWKHSDETKPDQDLGILNDDDIAKMLAEQIAITEPEGTDGEGISTAG